MSDILIEGKMVAVDFIVSSLSLHENVYTEDRIKRMLCEELVHELLDKKYIEFTRQTNVADDSFTFRARTFVLPDDKIRILRLLGNNRNV